MILRSDGLQRFRSRIIRLPNSRFSRLCRAFPPEAEGVEYLGKAGGEPGRGPAVGRPGVSWLRFVVGFRRL